MTRADTITIQAQHLTRWRDKSVGLIGHAQPTSVLLRTHFGIHTFGLRFPIDVVILNKRNEVVKIFQSVPPGRICLWPPQYDIVIELPAGKIALQHIQVGSIINVVLSPVEQLAK